MCPEICSNTALRFDLSIHLDKYLVLKSVNQLSFKCEAVPSVLWILPALLYLRSHMNYFNVYGNHFNADLQCSLKKDNSDHQVGLFIFLTPQSGQCLFSLRESGEYSLTLKTHFSSSSELVTLVVLDWPSLLNIHKSIYFQSLQTLALQGSRLSPNTSSLQVIASSPRVQVANCEFISSELYEC